MKNSYLIKLPFGDLITLTCTQFELRKKIAEKLTNISEQQIVILDKDFQLFDLNRLIMATQIQGRAQIQYQVFDLQQLIKEWLKQSQCIQSQKANLEAKAIEIFQLKKELYDQMALLNVITLENQSVSSKYAALTKSTNEQITTLKQQLEDIKNKNLKDVEVQIQMVSQKQEFEQEKTNMANALNDINEKNSKLEAQYNQLINQFNQLQAENTNNIQQVKQQYEQLQYCTQYIQIQSAYLQSLQTENQIKEANCQELQQQIKDLEDKYKQDIYHKMKQAKQKENEADTVINQLQSDLQNQKSTVSRQTIKISNLETQINEIELEKNSKEQFGPSLNQEAQVIYKELIRKKNELLNVAFERDNLITVLENQKIQFTQQYVSAEQKYQALILQLADKANTPQESTHNYQRQFNEQLSINKVLNLKLNKIESALSQLNEEIASLNHEISIKQPKQHPDQNFDPALKNVSK